MVSRRETHPLLEGQEGVTGRHIVNAADSRSQQITFDQRKLGFVWIAILGFTTHPHQMNTPCDRGVQRTRRTNWPFLDDSADQAAHVK